MGRAASFNVAQLLTYDASKQFAVQHLGTGGTETLGTHIIAALLAGAAATAASAPFENAKTHAQASSSRTSVVALCRTHGVAAMYRTELLLVAKNSTAYACCICSPRTSSNHGGPYAHIILYIFNS